MSGMPLACGHGCELSHGHPGPHKATVLLFPASPDWTGSPEQEAHFRANPPRLIDTSQSLDDAERVRRARLARFQRSSTATHTSRERGNR